MKDELISFETAKLAKEKGYQNGSKSIFTEYHKAFVYDGDKNHPESHKKGEIREDFDFFIVNDMEKYGDYSNKNYTLFERPTQSLLQRWLREVKGIDLWFGECNSPNRYQVEDIVKIENNLIIGGSPEGSSTYEEALEKGLLEALKLL